MSIDGGTNLQILMSGLAFPESPRWHDGRLWVSDWGANEVVAIDPDGKSQIVARVSSFPMCIAHLPDGRLLVVWSSDRRLVRQEPDGKSLFLVANDWGETAEGMRAGQVLTARAPAPRAGWP